MNLTPVLARLCSILAVAGTLTAALGTSARAQEAGAAPAPAPSSAGASTGQAVAANPRALETESAPARGLAAETASNLKIGSEARDDLRFSMQPEQAEAGGAASRGAPGAAAPDDAHELAKKLQNPIANLISVPLQFNYDTGYGPNDADRVSLNVQPVIPFSISEDWNLITRTIVPVIYQEPLADGLSSDLGLGDTTQSFFFSPTEPIGGWIIGAGPVALWPTGTSPRLRSESLGFGPTLVALKQEHGWTYGALVNHIWSVTDSDDHDQVNNTFLQPFLSYTWPTATTLAVNTESSYNWSREEWTVPLHVILRQLLKPGGLPIQLELGGTYYAESPDSGPEWGLRFTVTFVLPK